jgi:hypothetical protein
VRRRRRRLWILSFGVLGALLVLIAIAMRERREDDRAERRAEQRELWVETRGAVPATSAAPVADGGATDSAPGYSVSRLLAAANALLPDPANAADAPAADAGSATTETAALSAGDAAGAAADAGAVEAVGDAGNLAAEAGAPALAAPIPCGTNTCTGGQVCCNASCGICAPPGEQCSQQPCGFETLPISAFCGNNTCNVGYVCCNPSCGTCVRQGETCDTTACDNAIEHPVSLVCGLSTCNVGMDCCNPSCGTCVPRGQTCSKEPRG